MSTTSTTVRQSVCTILSVLGLVMALLVVFAPAARAATFTVTANRITGNAGTDDVITGSCDSDCSLRDAVQEANATSGADIITFEQAGTVALGTTGIENEDAASNDLDVNEELTVQGVTDGAGDPAVTIDASGIAGSDDGRIFDVDPMLVGAVPLTLQDVALTSGSVAQQGGAVRTSSEDPLTIRNSRLDTNHADGNGGAIGVTNGGQLTIEGSRMAGNTAGGFGGAISALESQSARIEGTVLSENIAGTTDGGGSGGAVFFGGIEPGTTLEILQSTFERNRAVAGTSSGSGRGGAVAMGFGAMEVQDSLLRSNGFDSTGDVQTLTGGAIATQPDVTTQVTIANTTLTRNRAGATGGGASLGTEQGPILITNSAMVRNQAGSSAGGLDLLASGDVQIANTTVSTNDAPELASGIAVAASPAPRTVSLQHVTVHSNRTTAGIAVQQGAEVQLHTTLIADNPTNCTGGGTFTSVGFNLEDASSCNLAQPSDLTATGPGTGALSSNGGQPQGAIGSVVGPTHALQSGSAALDAADPTTCGSAPADVDQRFVDRPQPTGDACDIGAFELRQDEPDEGADLELVKSVAPSPIQVGDSSTYQITVTNHGPSTAADVEVTDAIPNDLTIDDVTTTEGSCSTAGQTIACSLGDLDSGDTATIEIEVTATATGSFPNDATVTTTTDDPNPDNDDGSATLVVGDDGGFDPGTNRCEGITRIQTAIDCSQQVFEDADAVVLTRSDLFPDAQAGTPLAIAEDAPMLLSTPEQLDADTEDEILRLLDAGDTVYLLGGTVALAQAVQDRISELGFTPVRYGGINRFETAAIIAEDGLSNPDTLLAANGGDFADSVVAGAASVGVGSTDQVEAAVILTSGPDMSPQTQDYLDSRTDDPTIIAVGGDACAVFTGSECLQGPSRFETAIAVADRFFDGPPVIGLATGLDFADALVGGAIVGRPGIGPGPMLLTDPDDLPTSVEDHLSDNAADVDVAVIFGGLQAISQQVEDDVNVVLNF